MELELGARVGEYVIDGPIGSGSMGALYAAHHASTGDVAALKLMSDEAARTAHIKRRFYREARAAKAVEHPNIVKIFEVFEHDDKPVIAMELLNGRSFEDLIVERGGRLSVQELATICVRITSALGFAHAQGIIHRDLKPLNVFITDEPDGSFGVRVLDFGIAKLRATEGLAAATAALTETGAVMGTPYYMSPEQATGEKDVDQRADIWSLGIILYRALSGSIPTEGTSLGDVFRKVVLADFEPLDKLAPEAPKDLVVLVQRMLSRERAERPWDLREVHEVLSRHTETEAQSFGKAVVLPPDEDDVDVDAATAVRSTPSSSLPVSRQLAPSAIPEPIAKGGTVMLPERGGAPTSSPEPGTKAETRREPSIAEDTIAAPPMRSYSTLIVGALMVAVAAALAAWKLL